MFQFAGLVSARTYPEDYWKQVMDGKPMPQAIKDLYHQDSSSSSHIPSSQNSKAQNPLPIQKVFDVIPQVFLCNPPIPSKTPTD